MRLTLLLAAAVALASFATQAAKPVNLNARTANDLADLCGANPREPGSDAKVNFCHGFAQGAVDVELRRAGEKKPFCFPSPPPSRAATMSEFVNWVRSMPEHRKEGAIDGLFQFLALRFPCK